MLSTRQRVAIFGNGIYAATAGAAFVSEYVANWLTSITPASSFPINGLTHLQYFVAVPNADGTLGDYDPTFAQAVVQAAGSTPVSLVVGGWTGSGNFSTILASQTLSATLTESVQSAVQSSGFSGIEIDWEYPNGGMSCNAKSPNDAQNLVKYMQGLRQQVGTSLQLGLAVSVSGIDGLDDYSALSDAVDYAVIMVYDISTPNATPQEMSANAPLYSCPGAPDASVTSGIAAYTSKGFDSKKLILGVPAYGYSFGGIASAPQSLPVAYTQPGVGGKTSNPAGPDSCGDVWPASSNWLYSELAAADLSSDGTQRAKGWTRIWDQCSQTPVLYSAGSQTAISYDDAESVQLKGALARCAGLGGLSFFSASGDTADHTLLNAALKGFQDTSIPCPTNGNSTSGSTTSSASTADTSSSTSASNSAASGTSSVTAASAASPQSSIGYWSSLAAIALAILRVYI